MERERGKGEGLSPLSITVNSLGEKKSGPSYFGGEPTEKKGSLAVVSNREKRGLGCPLTGQENGQLYERRKKKGAPTNSSKSTEMKKMQGRF